MDTLPLELFGEIANQIRGDFIAFTGTCKTLNALNTVAERAKRSNHLLTLMKHNPDKEWKVLHLSKNTNISWEYICAHPEKPSVYFTKVLE